MYCKILVVQDQQYNSIVATVKACLFSTVMFLVDLDLVRIKESNFHHLHCHIFATLLICIVLLESIFSILVAIVFTMAFKNSKQQSVTFLVLIKVGLKELRQI